LRALVAGFMTIDNIQLPARNITSIGGPPCYAGLVCSRFGLDVRVLTKIGPDFPDEQVIWLARNGIPLSAGDRSSLKTTRFKIEVNGNSRTLFLVSKCEDLTASALPEGRFDGALISPIAQEVSMGLLKDIAAKSDFTFLDPQGFVRFFDDKGKVSIGKPKEDGLAGAVDALKMDTEEAQALTGKKGPKEALSKLATGGLRKAVVTRGGDSSYVLDGSRIYEIPVPKVGIVDTTGAGDILGGALLASYLRTRDFLWSACFGVAASSLSLTMIALAKVDLPMTVDEQAKRLYSLASPVASA
jgi:sugar/nucleoside kinase (ribokinase family)